MSVFSSCPRRPALAGFPSSIVRRAAGVFGGIACSAYQRWGWSKPELSDADFLAGVAGLGNCVFHQRTSPVLTAASVSAPRPCLQRCTPDGRLAGRSRRFSAGIATLASWRVALLAVRLASTD